MITAIIGSYFCFGNLMSPMLSPYGLTVQQLAVAGGCTSLIGMFGMIGTGWFVDKTKMFKKTLIFLALFGAISLFVFTNYTLPYIYEGGSNSVVFVMINISLLGLFMLPALPICLTFSAEVTYPMQSSLSTGICQFASAMGSSILSLIGSMILSTDVS